jgi:uncharacterized protein
MSVKSLLPLFLLFLLPVALWGQESQDFPSKPSPARLVNDLTGNTLSPQQAAILENKLRRYADSTSTQLVIVILRSTGTYETSDYTIRLAKYWGIGQKGQNNGLLLLLALEDRKFFTATGYGLEGVLPDALVRQIQENHLKPSLKESNYFQALDETTTAFIQAIGGEYKAPSRPNAGPEGGSSMLLPILLTTGFFFFIFWAMRRNRRSGGFRRSGGGPPFIIFGSGGSYGGNGGGGGFDFGGGDFGGGGAGGDW